MTTWAVKTLVGAVWTVAAAIPAPNEQFSEKTVSTMVKTTLADGSIGRIIPPTKYNKQPLRWAFRYQTSVKARFEGYVESATGLQVTTHTTQVFEGRMTAVDAQWIPYGSTQKYVLLVEFDEYEVG